MSIYDNIVSTCRELLLTFPEAKSVSEYANSRLSANAQEKFSIGYFPDNTNLITLSSIVGDEGLSALGIIYDKVFQDGISTRKVRHATLENHNLVLPYRDVYGRMVAIVGRTILGEEERGNIAKYKNTSFDKGNHLFGLFDAKKSIMQKNIAIVVEGQFDCITAVDNGIDNIVALGSSNMTFEQFSLLNRYTDNIVLLLDNDMAGNVGAERIIRIFGKYANIRQGKLPMGQKDIDEALKENTAEELLSYI
jgi:DNA primase catalytic core